MTPCPTLARRATATAPERPPTCVPSLRSVLALQAALGEALRDAGAQPRHARATHPALVRQMRAICAEAHEAGLRPEGLLVACKPLLCSLPELRPLPPDARDAMVRGLISLCIRTYYQTVP